MYDILFFFSLPLLFFFHLLLSWYSFRTSNFPIPRCPVLSHTTFPLVFIVSFLLYTTSVISFFLLSHVLLFVPVFFLSLPLPFLFPFLFIFLVPCVRFSSLSINQSIIFISGNEAHNKKKQKKEFTFFISHVSFLYPFALFFICCFSFFSIIITFLISDSLWECGD